MIARQTRPVSLDEFLRLPETEPYTELVDGVMEQKPVGKNNHSVAQMELAVLLRFHPATQSGRAVTELGVRFPGTRFGNLRVPDVVFYRDRSAIDLGQDYPEAAPDLAAEIRSKGQPLRVLRERLAFLREQGTLATLLIDPDAATVEVHDGAATWTASGDDEVVIQSLGGFSFRAGQLFE
jgi:Uma2 family endonuclease